MVLLQDAVLMQGTFVAIVLAVGWAAAAGMRRAERLRQAALKTRLGAGLNRKPELATQTCSTSTSHGASNGINHVMQQAESSMAADSSVCTSPWPGLSIVLPVRGCRPHSLSNWSSHLRMQYGGQLEFLFVLDSHEDAAWQPLEQLRALHSDPGAVRLLVSGPASTCSQKIHNLVAGCRASCPGSEYVLFLDDDVELHPGCAQQLVELMQRDTSLFMATGYPFDLPPKPGASLATYCFLVYHLPLLIAFSVKQRTDFVWGGCMLLRRRHLVPTDTHGVLQAWLDGGYSDDLLLAALCTREALPIAVPSFAIFPQWLEERYTWRQYLNYLHRQLYVLDTYANRHNRLLNHMMMAVHTWASMAWAASALLVLWRAVAGLLLLVLSAYPHAPAMRQDHLGRLRAHAGAQGSWVTVAAFACCCMAAQASLYWMTAEVLGLLSLLSPARPLTARPERHFSFVRLWIALLVESCLLPGCVLYTLVCPYVDWGGIRYCKHRGKVTCSRRPDSPEAGSPKHD